MKNEVKKGIILAGGSGSRLYPVTQVACKQLLPLYDKPMIYYPLSTLMLFGITDILIISTPKDIPQFEGLFGDGHHLGLNISYKIQENPAGIAQAFIIGADFIGDDNVILILGDNIFYGVYDFLRHARDFREGATVFGYYVRDPQRYGVVEFDEKGVAVSIEEKPKHPKSNFAVTGLYLYDNRVVEIARNLKPSGRGELEITDVNRAYLKMGQLRVEKLGRGIAWLDTGTHESMLDAQNFIATIEKRQGLKIACIEEIAYRMRFINRKQMQFLLDNMADNDYKKYLLEVVREVDGEEKNTHHR
ncbi:dTDP-glucose pyrophosphorylase (glucose-1-phosphate thymidylyltransferase) [Candidatus Zixiibacteriota bacterium]|nr:dTDP-glucose pyrophosphorylase (glucose-1-phosphate thymidylyltransferase) [candidate division Zixibacteria bacterium]